MVSVHHRHRRRFSPIARRRRVAGTCIAALFPVGLGPPSTSPPARLKQSKMAEGSLTEVSTTARPSAEEFLRPKASEGFVKAPPPKAASSSPSATPGTSQKMVKRAGGLRRGMRAGLAVVFVDGELYCAHCDVPSPASVFRRFALPLRPRRSRQSDRQSAQPFPSECRAQSRHSSSTTRRSFASRSRATATARPTSTALSRGLVIRLGRSESGNFTPPCHTCGGRRAGSFDNTTQRGTGC